MSRWEESVGEQSQRRKYLRGGSCMQLLFFAHTGQMFLNTQT